MKVITAQLLATRDTLVAAISQIDATLVGLGVDLGGGEEPTGCEHPRAQVTAPTMEDGKDSWTCGACGAESHTPFHEE